MSSFFQLGKIPELSLAELNVLLPQHKFRLAHPQLAVTDQTVDLSLETVLAMSGGIVSGGNVLEDRDVDVVALVERSIGSEIRSVAVSLLMTSANFSAKLLLDEVKDRRKQQGLSLRYVLPTAGMHEMRSAALYHEMKDRRFAHFIIWQESVQFRIAKTAVVQNVDEWSELDYGKPARRIHEGMLPPKVARMMVNLGLGQMPASLQAPLVYDPFCGSGSVLIEGARVGCKVLGSDLSADAVASTQENIDWYIQRRDQKYPKHPIFGFPWSIQPNLRAFTGDAVHLDKYFSEREVDVVVTEPYMGPLFTSSPTLEQAKNQQKGLLKLYLGFFKSLRHALKKGGVVVFSLPFYRLDGKVMRINLVDRLRDFGYNPIIPSIDYFVEHTIVGREIIILRLEN